MKHDKCSARFTAAAASPDFWVTFLTFPSGQVKALEVVDRASNRKSLTSSDLAVKRSALCKEFDNLLKLA